MARRALDGNPETSTKHGEPGYGYFGKHAGYDYPVVKWPVKAPEAGVVTSVKVAPNADGGNIVELDGQYSHRFLHLDSISVTKGQKVAEGDTLAISGNTGNVGYHLHHDTRKKGTAWTDSYSNYVDWESIIKQGGEDMSLTESQQDKALKMGLQREPRADELSNPEWKANPGLLIDTLWGNGGEAIYRESQKPKNYIPVTEQLYKKG